MASWTFPITMASLVLLTLGGGSAAHAQAPLPQEIEASAQARRTIQQLREQQNRARTEPLRAPEPVDTHQMLMDFCHTFAHASRAVVGIRALGANVTTALSLLVQAANGDDQRKRLSTRLVLQVYRYPATATATQVYEQLLSDCLLMPEAITGLSFPAVFRPY